MQGVLSYRAGWRGVWGEEGGKKIGLDGYGRFGPVDLGICKPPLSLERCVVFGESGPHFLARRLFRLVKHVVLGVFVFGHVFLRALKNALVCSFALWAPASHF